MEMGFCESLWNCGTDEGFLVVKRSGRGTESE